MMGQGPLVLSLRAPSLCTRWKATLFTVSIGSFKVDCMNSLIAPSGLLDASSGIPEKIWFSHMVRLCMSSSDSFITLFSLSRQYMWIFYLGCECLVFSLECENFTLAKLQTPHQPCYLFTQLFQCWMDSSQSTSLYFNGKEIVRVCGLICFLFLLG